MFEKIENKWTEDSGDYDDMIQTFFTPLHPVLPSQSKQKAEDYFMREKYESNPLKLPVIMIHTFLS